MKTIEEIREAYQKAEETRRAATTEFRKFMDGYNEERRKISANQDYSAEGRQKQLDKLAEERGREFLGAARDIQAEYKATLKAIKAAANDIYYAKTSQPDPEEMSRFQRDFSEIKTRILLANAEKGKKILQEFLGAIDNPAQADVVKAEFSTLIAPIMQDASASDLPHFRRDLQHAFDTVIQRSLPPEAFEAVNLAEQAEAAISSGKYFSLPVVQAAKGLGMAASVYANDPEKYFNKQGGNQDA